MAAQPYTTIGSVALNLIYQCDGIVGMESLQAAIGLWMVGNPIVVGSSLSQDEINDMLRKLTGCTVATGTDMNCYPRGADLTTCFDLDGNEIF